MEVVTGGLGFIGNELVRQLKSSGRKVVIIDNENRVATHLEDIQDVPRYRVDITDSKAVEDVIGILKPDRVFHLAAIHYIPECNADPQRTMRINVEGTLALLNASIKHDCKHFLLASTGAVYYDSPQPLTEESPIAPVDIYGWSKWFAEDLCRWKSAEMPITICRLFNNIGLRETNAHIVPEIIQQLKEGNNALTLGNITPIRDYISTQDTAQALVQLSQIIPATYDVFNIATGKGTSVKELIHLMAALLNKELEVKTDPSRFRKADKEVQLADITKLENKLSWTPRQDMKQVLLDLMKFEGLL
jgi:UDP-glucose 4-epimerase